MRVNQQLTEHGTTQADVAKQLHVARITIFTGNSSQVNGSTNDGRCSGRPHLGETVRRRLGVHGVRPRRFLNDEFFFLKGPLDEKTSYGL